MAKCQACRVAILSATAAADCSYLVTLNILTAWDVFERLVQEGGVGDLPHITIGWRDAHASLYQSSSPEFEELPF